MPIIRDDNRVPMDFDRFTWMNAWVDDETLSTGAVAVLAVLLRYMGPDGKAWPSYESLTAKAGMSVNSLRKYLKEIAGAGYIERQERFSTTPVYNASYPRGTKSCDLPNLGTSQVPNLGTSQHPESIEVPNLGTSEVPNLGRGGVPNLGTQTDYRTDYITDHAEEEAEGSVLEMNNRPQVDGFILPPDISGERQEWMPRLQGWILDLMGRDSIRCSIPEAAKIVERIAGAKLSDEERIRYLTDDIAAKAERVASKKMDASLAVRCIATTRDIEWWKESQKPKAAPVTPEGGKKGRTYEDPFAWATDEQKRIMGVIK